MVETIIKTIGVGTDGSDTAQKAVDFAMDMAERYQAKLVIASAYKPVAEDRLRKEQTEAPQEIQWSINPSEEVDAALRAAEEQFRWTPIGRRKLKGVREPVPLFRARLRDGA